MEHKIWNINGILNSNNVFKQQADNFDISKIVEAFEKEFFNSSNINIHTMMMKKNSWITIMVITTQAPFI